MWSPQYESNANLVLHKTTNSQNFKENVQDTLLDNYHDKTPFLKEKQIVMNVISNINDKVHNVEAFDIDNHKTSNVEGKFPFVKSSNFYLGKS